MIRHCVFICYRPEISAVEKSAIARDIVALKSLVPGMVAVNVGSNTSPEIGMDKGFSEGFIVDFADAAARDAYLVHPEHQKAGNRIVAASEGGIAGVLVYDLDVPA